MLVELVLLLVGAALAYALGRKHGKKPSASAGGSPPAEREPKDGTPLR